MIGQTKLTSFHAITMSIKSFRSYYCLQDQVKLVNNLIEPIQITDRLTKAELTVLRVNFGDLLDMIPKKSFGTTKLETLINDCNIKLNCLNNFNQNIRDVQDMSFSERESRRHSLYHSSNGKLPQKGN